MLIQMLYRNENTIPIYVICYALLTPHQSQVKVGPKLGIVRVKLGEVALKT